MAPVLDRIAIASTGSEAGRSLHLQTMVDAFPVLMTARHAADYDHLESFPRAVAQGHVEEASAACTLLDKNAGDPYVKRFLALVVFRARRLQ